MKKEGLSDPQVDLGMSASAVCCRIENKQFRGVFHISAPLRFLGVLDGVAENESSSEKSLRYIRISHNKLDENAKRPGGITPI
jgi:hypothetical protein